MMRLQKEVYEAYKEHINTNLETNRKGGLAVKEYLEHSPLYWNGIVEKTVHIPKVIDKETLGLLQGIAAKAHGIFGKVIREYRENPEYRKLFPFSEELTQLMLLPKQYEKELPIARFDLFYNEESGEFKFCEINTDGTAAMLRDKEMRKALIMNPAHQAVIRRYKLQGFELFETWVAAFMKLYAAWPDAKENPNVAIIDYLENSTLRDFEEFARTFQKAGVNCEICDVRELVLKDGRLYSPAGNPIDAIYRRAVTADVMAHYEESGAFLQSVRDNKVFMAGAFDTQVIHSKWLFRALHNEMTESFLSPDEMEFVKRHIPFTVGLNDGKISLEDLKRDKDRYMIKPADSYASKGTYAAGRKCSQEEWDALTEKLWGGDYICQEFCEQYLTDNIDFAWGDGAWHKYLNMIGLYVYDGSLAGFLMRMAEGDGIITAHENERTVPVFLVEGAK
ncbi:MAG: glutathionylspermidine synthase family protein [Lachnospiraceae bacterium]|nr:glutathionylspermidine synthase family protein [Lachnospiraceae bacterium]